MKRVLASTLAQALTSRTGTLALVAALACTVAGGCASEDGGDDDMNPRDADAGMLPTPDSGGMDVPPPPVMCEGLEAEIGTGLASFIPVMDGDTVALYRGPQGGYMIYLGVRAKGLDPSDVYVSYTWTFTATGEVFGTGTWRVKLGRDIGDGWFERVGVWGQVDPSYWTTPSKIRGKAAIVDVTLTDKNGCTIDGLGWSILIDSEPGM